MKILVVFGSTYGNTRQIAHAICDALGSSAKLAEAGEVQVDDVKGVELLIIGSPTQGGRPMPSVQNFLVNLPSLEGVSVAAFDTRFAKEDHGFGLKLVMKMVGYAAPRIAITLQEKGGHLVLPPEGFIVEGKDGPLKSGEIERAANWAQKLLK